MSFMFDLLFFLVELCQIIVVYEYLCYKGGCLNIKY